MTGIDWYATDFGGHIFKDSHGSHLDAEPGDER